MKKELINAFDNKILVPVNGYNFVINPLTEQIPYTSASLLRTACEEIASKINKRTTKIVGEEDKGGILVAGVSLLTDLPFGMARWYPSGLAGQIQERLSMEYLKEGTLYLNGVEKADSVTIIEDMVSTGGTLIALIKAIKRAKATIVDIITLVEKITYGARERIKRETGRDFLSIIQIDTSGSRSKVKLHTLTGVASSLTGFAWSETPHRKSSMRAIRLKS